MFIAIIAAIAFAGSCISNGADLSIGTAFQVGQDLHNTNPDPLGIVRLDTKPGKNVDLYAQHTSSIPDTSDNKYGLNVFGVNYTVHIKGLLE